MLCYAKHMNIKYVSSFWIFVLCLISFCVSFLGPFSITPVFTLSSVSGENLELLKVFFNILPPLSNSKEQEELMQQLTEFQVNDSVVFFYK